MTEFEKRDVPTVSYTAERFMSDAHRSAISFGLSGLPIAVMPVPFTNQPADSIQRMVSETLSDVIAGLTRPIEEGVVDEEITLLPDETLTFEGGDLLECAARMNEQFLAYGWTDGFPLIPPTPDAVDRMCRGYSKDPDTVITKLEPGFGLATVRALATNAVMAGCRPEHLPILIAAVRCLADPAMYLRNKAMSTGPHAPLMIVNGPIARELNINSGRCALGPGAPSYANTVIGRALRLIMMNVGHCYPGVGDMDTIGSPTKYSMCVAENEAESPWNPYHVDAGYERDADTVTVQFVYSAADVRDFKSTGPETLAQVFATATLNSGSVGTGLWLIGRRGDPRYKLREKEHNIFLVGPEHAQTFVRGGWSKADVQEALYRLARLPFKTLMLTKEGKGLEEAHPELRWIWEHPDLMLPVVETPDCNLLVVVGGAAGRTIYCAGAGAPVTKLVER